MLPPIAADSGRFLASVVFGLLSLVLFVPAVLGVAHLLHRQRPLLALIGAALVLVGILSSAVLHGVQLVQHQMIHPAADREQMVELLTRLEGGMGAKVVLVGLSVGLFLGWVIWSAGRLATRVVPRGIPVAVFVSLVINFAGLERFSRVFFLIGLGWLGVLVLVRRDDGRVSAGTTRGPSSP